MRSSTYCTANSYKMSELVQYLVDQGYEPKYFDEVIHFNKNINNEKSADVFVFPFGVVSMWDVDEVEDRIILEELEAFQEQSLADPTVDLVFYEYNEKEKKSFIDEDKNIVIVNDKNVFIKLSMAHALAQSVKLEVLEESVSRLLEQTTPIRKELASRGTVSLSKTEISKQIGVLFNERYSINMHSDILDTPEFFWRRPSYEPVYLMMADFQDTQVRQNILNHRLDMIHELYSILSNELNYKHSTRLEWIIIVLIAIEVITGLVHTDSLMKLYHLFF